MTVSLDRVSAATPAFFDEDLRFDEDALREHFAWIQEHGVTGLTPNGSLGEYQALDPAERARAVELAVECALPGTIVMPGIGAQTTDQAVHWATQARDVGAHAVMALPPTGYRLSADEAMVHYERLAGVGIPIVVYNNPFDVKIDLTPDLLACIATLDNVVGVKEFSCDVRRIPEIVERAPSLTPICGADDVLLESMLVGARGWISGFANALPVASMHLFEGGRDGRFNEVVPIYLGVLPLFRWDSVAKFVQAIKLTLEVRGRRGGPTRSPRMPLTRDEHAAVVAASEAALAIERLLA